MSLWNMWNTRRSATYLSGQCIQTSEWLVVSERIMHPKELNCIHTLYSTSWFITPCGFSTIETLVNCNTCDTGLRSYPERSRNRGFSGTKLTDGDPGTALFTCPGSVCSSNWSLPGALPHPVLHPPPPKALFPSKGIDEGQVRPIP